MHHAGDVFRRFTQVELIGGNAAGEIKVFESDQRVSDQFIFFFEFVVCVLADCILEVRGTDQEFHLGGVDVVEHLAQRAVVLHADVVGGVDFRAVLRNESLVVLIGNFNIAFVTAAQRDIDAVDLRRHHIVKIVEDLVGKVVVEVAQLCDIGIEFRDPGVSLLQHVIECSIGAFQIGGKLISAIHSANGYLNMLDGRRNNIDVDYWTEENTGAKYPKPGGIMSSDNPKYGSTLGYFNAGYLKIRAITLGYDFAKLKPVKDFGISRLRLYATIQNPFVLFSPFNNESGLDPETNSWANENTAVAYGEYSGKHKMPIVGYNTPSTRNFLIGVNVAF